MKHYVLGFAFNAIKDHVVLINKLRPSWQKGCLNGVGGSIEEGESGDEAMVREFREETGVDTLAVEWSLIGTMGGDDWTCHIYKAEGDSFMSAETMEDEKVLIYPVQEVVRGDYITISNLPFLIELCRDINRPKNVLIFYA